jgi:hypothetical protein
MRKPALELVVSNGDFGRQTPATATPPRLVKVADNGPKIRIKTGLLMTPRNPINTSGHGVDFFASKVVECLPHNLRRQISYGTSPGNIRAEVLGAPCGFFLSNGHTIIPVWLEIQESPHAGPWRSARKLNAHLGELAAEYGELLRAVSHHVGHVQLYYKLLAYDTERLPDWFDAWRSSRSNVALHLYPPFESLFKK